MNIQSIDIVLPCFNPREGWVETVVDSVKKIRNIIPQQSIHIILVNDGSTINCNRNDLEVLRHADKDLTYIEYSSNKGKGYALRQGIQAANADVIIYTDIDLPYEEEAIKEVVSMMEKDETDIIIGVRDRSYYKKAPPFRRLISRWLRVMVQFFLNLPVSDTQGGFKAFNQLGKQVFMKTTINRYLFDIEFIRLATRQQELRVTGLPVKLKPGITLSKVNLLILFSEAINFIRILFK